MSTGDPQAPRPLRVRMAPSPTGYFHVGSARTALYNWCVARRGQGTFVLRIEDTDRERHQEEQYQGILDALSWLGINWDEGPYRQSERSALYQANLDLLFDGGDLYACDCTREQVEARTKDRPTPGYDGYCRSRGLERGPGRALRFAVPEDGTTVVHDVIRGDVEFANHTIEDFVVAKSNGDALFVLAVVTDDREMAISHVIRAEEHLPTTPKAVLLWEALNALGRGRSDGAVMPLPLFAHLPVLVNDRRQKISKRRDRVAIEDYRFEGYLPEAIGNYLALLGWSFPDGHELFTRDELVEAFRLEDVNHSPAFFDLQKLKHFNGVYIRQLSDAEFTDRCRTWARETENELGTSVYESREWSVLAPLVRERVAVLGEVPGYVEFLRDGEPSMDSGSWDKAVAGDSEAGAILAAARSGLEELPGDRWLAEAIKEVMTAVAGAHGRKLGKAQAPVRVATMGSTVGLPLFESLQVLGRDAVLRRLSHAQDRLRANLQGPGAAQAREAGSGSGTGSGSGKGG
ncbi:MAG: glutamate--tRNA ligase [Acidimicrobiales bacterium]